MRKCTGSYPSLITSGKSLPIFLVLLLFLLATSTVCHGVQKIFTLNGESTQGDAIIPLADGYLVLSDHGTKQNFTKFNLAGQKVLSKDFLNLASVVSGATDAYPHSAIKTSDGGYLICGIVNPRPQKGFLVKLDSGLNFSWGRIFNHIDIRYDMWMGGIKQTSDGKYIVAVKGQYPQPFIGVVKLNTNGTEVWQNSVFTVAQNEVFDIFETSNAYVFYGSLEHNKANNDWDLLLIAINKDGTGTGADSKGIVWGFAFGGDKFEGTYAIAPVLYPRASGIVQIDATHLAIAAYTKSFGVNPASHPGDTNGNSVLLATFLTNGTALTGLAYLDGPGDDLIAGPYGNSNLLKTADGNLLIGGMTTSSWTNPDAYAGAFLAKITPNLSSIVWQRTYTPFSITGGNYHLNAGALFLSLAETATGEIAAVGKVAIGGGQSYQSMFTILPANGQGDYSCLYESPARFTLTQWPAVKSSTLSCTDGFCVDQGQVNLTSFSSPSTATPTVNLICYPQISVIPSTAYSFGSVLVNGMSAPLLVTITNSASCPNRLIVSDPYMTGPDGGMYHIAPASPGSCDYLNLDPGESCALNIGFKPTSTGNKTAIFRVESNDPNTPVREVALSGSGTISGDFGASPLSGSAPLVVNFIDTSTNNPYIWSWDFGDGSFSNLQNPVHNFKTAGTFTVAMTSTGAGGTSVKTMPGYISVAACANKSVHNKVSATYYQKIIDGCDAATNGETVMVQALDFTENLVLTNNSAYKLVGGYGCNYSTNPQYTTVMGSLTVNSGSVTVHGLILR